MKKNRTEIIKKLNEFREIDLSKKTIREIAIEIDKYLQEIPTTYVVYNKNKFNNFIFYRVRFNINKDEDISLIQTYSFPLPQFCNVNGRANLKGKSVFYSSNCAFTAIQECKAEVGAIGYLSIWKPRTNRSMKGTVFLPRNMKEEYSYKDDPKFAINVKSALEQIHIDNIVEAEEKINFIAERFENEKPPYSITSFLSNEVLYGDLKHDFIVYPSIANEMYTLNFAFHPNIVTNFLYLEKVIRIKLVRIENNQYTIGVGKVGYFENGRIIWRQGNSDEINLKNLPMSNIVY